MKKKTQHFKSVNVKTNVYEALQNNLPNVKVQVQTFYHNELICEFFVPSSSLVTLGMTKWVPSEIVKSRAKHDFGITWDHSSATIG